MTEAATFADVTIANLVEAEARFVLSSIPDDARGHVRPSMHADRFVVLVEDLTFAGARDLFGALTDYRVSAAFAFPDVPDWRDIRTGTERAWRNFADTHGINYPDGSTRERVAMAVRSWLEKNR